MVRFLNCKKGIGRNVMIAVVLIFVTAFLWLIGFIIGNGVLDIYSSTLGGNASIDNAIGKFRGTFNLFDKMLVIVAITLIAGIAVTSFRIASRPVFVVVSFVLAAFYGFISYFFNFIFIEIFKQPLFLAIIGSFQATYILVTNLHWFSLVMIVTAMITLYAKKEKGQFLT